MAMYWQDERDKTAAYVVPDDIVDLNFKVDCRSLPLDHAYALSEAIRAALPWIGGEALAGIHLIHGAESGNGWIRPDNPDSDVLCLSRRTRFTLRLPKTRVEDAKALSGQTLDIMGNALSLSAPSVRKLSDQTTIFARHIASENADDDSAFLEEMVGLLGELQIRTRKMLSGRGHVIRTPEREIGTRSLMIAELGVDDSVRLQEQGLGPGRKLGCGLFLPHKGIEPVSKPQEG
jgi:CRISPR-associated protein Cas6